MRTPPRYGNVAGLMSLMAILFTLLCVPALSILFYAFGLTMPGADGSWFMRCVLGGILFLPLSVVLAQWLAPYLTFRGWAWVVGAATLALFPVFSLLVSRMVL